MCTFYYLSPILVSAQFKQIVETKSNNPAQLRKDIQVQAIQRYKAKLGNSGVGNGIFIADTVCTKTYSTELLL